MSWIAYKSNESNIRRDVREVIPLSADGTTIFNRVLGLVTELDLSLVAFISRQEQRYLGALERVDHNGPRSTLLVAPTLSRSGCYVYTPQVLEVFAPDHRIISCSIPLQNA